MYIADNSFSGIPDFKGLAGLGQTDPNALPCGDCPPSNWDGRGFGRRGTPTYMWGGETPPTKLDIFPHWVPSGGSPLPGLSWLAAQQKYRKLNKAIKATIEAKLAQAGTRPWGQEVRDIYDDLRAVDTWVRGRAVGGKKHRGPSGEHEQPDLVLYTAYKKAERMIAEIAPALTEQEEAAITDAMQPKAPSAMVSSDYIPASISRNTIILIGGGAALLLMVGVIILR